MSDNDSSSSDGVCRCTFPMVPRTPYKLEWDAENFAVWAYFKGKCAECGGTAHLRRWYYEIETTEDLDVSE